MTVYVHLLCCLCTLALLLVLRINGLLLLLDELGLYLRHEHLERFPPDISAHSRTFSIANSSSALTLISRAFSSASCLMNATYTTQHAHVRHTRFRELHHERKRAERCGPSCSSH